MTTWAEVKTYVHNKYKVEDVNEELMRLIFNLQNGRTQLVYIHHSFNESAQWIRINSPIGKVADLNVASAARIASEKIVGGIIIIGDFVYLTNAMPLENLDGNEVDEPLGRVMSTADEMERNLVGGDAF